MTTRPRVLLEDELGRGFAAAIQYGDYVFMSTSDGVREPRSETVRSEFLTDPIAQVRNSYERIAHRLDQAGMGAEAVARLEHYVSSVDWLLPRLALWKSYFGIELCTGGGSQAFMAAGNHISTVATAASQGAKRRVVAQRPQGPHQGAWAERKSWSEQAYPIELDLEDVRASKAVELGDLIFLIGARGLVSPETGEAAPLYGAEAFNVQVRNCMAEFRSYLAESGGMSRLIRLDAPIRDIRQHKTLENIVVQEVDTDRIPITHAVGMPVGWIGETDVQGIAAGTGTDILPRARTTERGLQLEAIEAAGLLFLSGCSGLPSPDGSAPWESFLNPMHQTKIALRRLFERLERVGVGSESILRIDLYLDDIGYGDDCLMELVKELGSVVPTVNVLGGRPAGGARAELVAIAAAANMKSGTTAHA